MMRAHLFAVLFILGGCGFVWLPGCAADEYEDNRDAGELSSRVTAAELNMEIFTRLDITPCSGTRLPTRK